MALNGSPICIRALFVIALLGAAPTTLLAQPTVEARPAEEWAQKLPARGYYVEFRVAQIGLYGHSYAMYGTSGGRRNYSDLHPVGGYAVMALGHVLPVPANTEWDPDVLKLPVAARYRLKLDEAQYRRLLAAVRSLKANKEPYWNAVSNNCNHFIGTLAQAVGLRVPGQFQVSYTFVPALRALNESERVTTAKSHLKSQRAAARS